MFNVYGEEKINSFNIKEGEELNVSFDINAREFNGRWYNDIRAWRVERGNPQAQPMQSPPNYAQPAQPAAPYGQSAPYAQPAAAPQPAPTVAPAPAGNSEDDLPF